MKLYNLTFNQNRSKPVTDVCYDHRASSLWKLYLWHLNCRKLALLFVFEASSGKYMQPGRPTADSVLVHIRERFSVHLVYRPKCRPHWFPDSPVPHYDVSQSSVSIFSSFLVSLCHLPSSAQLFRTTVTQFIHACPLGQLGNSHQSAVWLFFPHSGFSRLLHSPLWKTALLKLMTTTSCFFSLFRWHTRRLVASEPPLSTSLAEMADE